MTRLSARCQRRPFAVRYVGSCRFGAAMLVAWLSSVHGEPAGAGFRLKPELTTTAEWWRQHIRPAAERDGWNLLAELQLLVDLPGRPGVTQGLVAQGSWYDTSHGEPSFEEDTGIFLPISSIAAQRHARLLNLHYHRSWQNDRSRLKIGQLRLDDDFMLSDYAGLFCNGAFGSLPTQVATPAVDRAGESHGYPEYPLASPGLWFARQSAAETLVQLGIYSGAVGADVRSNRGLEWGRGRGAGAVGFLEVTIPGRRHRANTTRLGLSYHSGRHENFSASRANEPVPVAGSLWNAYAIQDLVVVSDTADNPVVGVFVRAGCSPDRDRSVVTAYADAGCNWFGPIPGRPDDALGVGFAHAHFGPAYRRLANRRSSESLVELTYRATLTARFSAQADVQWLQPSGPSPGQQGRVATVYGLRAVVNF